MLKGIKVLEFEGLAPTVFCGMYFADQGAEVILVARKEPAPFSMPIEANLMNRGKKCILLSPKIKKDKQIIEELIKVSDIIIDPYRPGVLQKLNIGPNFIYGVNKKAILLRVSGYGQQGPMSQRPGHDLNYISTSGIVPLINKNNKNEVYQFPTNFLADFVSCSLGITATLSALAISKKTGVGRIVDCSMTDGCRYYTKIITETNDKKEESQKEDGVIKFVNHGKQNYCVRSKEINIEKIRKQIEKMANQKKQYVKNDDYEISKVKELSQLSKQIKGLKNPFSNQFNVENLSIPSRGEHQDQIERILKTHQIRKSKL